MSEETFCVVSILCHFIFVYNCSVPDLTNQLFLKFSVFQAQVLRMLGAITAQLEMQGKLLRQQGAQHHRVERERNKPMMNPEIHQLLPLSSQEDFMILESLLAKEENREALVCQ